MFELHHIQHYGIEWTWIDTLGLGQLFLFFPGENRTISIEWRSLNYGLSFLMELLLNRHRYSLFLGNRSWFNATCWDVPQMKIDCGTLKVSNLICVASNTLLLTLWPEFELWSDADDSELCLFTISVIIPDAPLASDFSTCSATRPERVDAITCLRDDSRMRHSQIKPMHYKWRPFLFGKYRKFLARHPPNNCLVNNNYILDAFKMLLC